MKVIEILLLGRNFLDLLHESCIKIGDVRYIDMYGEYRKIMSRGEKKTYAVAFLSEKYGISERKVFYLIKEFEKDCKIVAGDK